MSTHALARKQMRYYQSLNPEVPPLPPGLPAVAEPEPVVELQRVSKSFREPSGRMVRALDAVSLTIRAGEFFALLGASGCGKTTLLRLVGGFEQPDTGTILIGGQAMERVPPYQRPVNTVFQNYALFPHLDVFENIAFGLRMEKLGREEIGERVEAALALVRLEKLADRRPAQLSGGQKQRVALARALVKRPQVLLLDEPLSALDLQLRQQLRLELQALQRQTGIAFVLVTHDQDEALTLSDRIAVMRAGQILQVGTATQIYERPASRFVAEFVGQTNWLVGTVAEILPEGVSVAVAGLGLVRGAPVVPLQAGEQVAVAVRPEKLVLAQTDAPKLPDWNWCAAQVVALRYAGAQSELELQLASQIRFRAQLANRAAAPVFAPGSSCQVGFACQDTVVLAADR